MQYFHHPKNLCVRMPGANEHLLRPYRVLQTSPSSPRTFEKEKASAVCRPMIWFFFFFFLMCFCLFCSCEYRTCSHVNTGWRNHCYDRLSPWDQQIVAVRQMLLLGHVSCRAASSGNARKCNLKRKVYLRPKRCLDLWMNDWMVMINFLTPLLVSKGFVNFFCVCVCGFAQLTSPFGARFT